jgi:hypothetical protein
MAESKPGKRAIALNKLASQYQGIQSDVVLDAVSGIGLSIIDRLLPTILEDDDLDDPNSEEAVKKRLQLLRFLSFLPAFMRECRSAAAQKEDLRYIKDKANLVLAGAQRMADILTLAFKDTTYAEGVSEAINGAMTQIELEVKGEGKQ